MYSDNFAPDALLSYNPARYLLRHSQLPLLLLLTIHLPLALAMRQSSAISTAHALIVLVIGAIVASAGRPLATACVCMYIAGSEVAWRMTGASLFWETGKYGIIAISGLLILRTARLRPPLLILGYFLLLLPSALLTLQAHQLDIARERISFTLSGPLAVLACAWLFSQIQLDRAGVWRLMLAFAIPTIMVAAIALVGILTAERLSFTTESNFQTSGGFGPNQVSATLGLGVVCCFWVVIDRGAAWWLRLLCSGLALWFFAQAIFTFSRGGVLGALLTIVVMALSLVRDSRSRMTMASLLTVGGLIMWLAVFPALNQVSGGTLAKRFQEVSTSGRDELVGDEIAIFLDHPFIGVGPGRTREFIGGGRFYETAVASHTELSRLLAEHGALGALAIVALVATAARAAARAPTSFSRAVVVGVALWSFLFMLGVLLTSFVVEEP